MDKVAVVIPTRNRPEKLRRCLTNLAEARQCHDFTVHVCDSSDDAATQAQVHSVCREFPFAMLHRHYGKNVACARNVCAQVADAELLVNVDDDIYVQPDSIELLVHAYEQSRKPCVIAGSVAWSDQWSRPVAMRLIGYGRSTEPGEPADFLIGAFFIYPRSLALAFPWNENIRSSDDRFMGAVWRSKGIRLGFEPRARAFHDHQHVSYGPEHQESHVYANLFDSLIANANAKRAFGYEVLGFAATARRYLKNRQTALPFLRAWLSGHRKFIRDWRSLKEYLASGIVPAEVALESQSPPHLLHRGKHS